MNTRIFVTVGTDHHPFTRLLDWMDDWAVDRPDVQLVVQHGAARLSRHGTNHALLGAEEIRAQYEAADLVVSQVGPGTIADANCAGHLPIVVPRDPALGEVVDDHQVAFGEFMSARGRCTSVRTRDHLYAELGSRLTAPVPADLPADVLPAATTSAITALSRTVLASPRRRPSARRLLIAVRRTAREPRAPAS